MGDDLIFKGKKAKDEIMAETAYKAYLSHVETVVGKLETNDDQLNQFGRLYIGTNFLGCFPRDRIPDLKEYQSCIINEDIHTGPGIHWMALFRGLDGYLFYDSFGRPHKIIMNNLNKWKVKDADYKDREQKLMETNCGARALAFLLVCYNLGPKYAELI